MVKKKGKGKKGKKGKKVKKNQVAPMQTFEEDEDVWEYHGLREFLFGKGLTIFGGGKAKKKGKKGKGKKKKK
eukprot:m.168489 g.168489  ORF g.168489 m.168489 type:complete len:72 (+) comp14478_c0_seq3:308-523(+)